MIVAHQMQQPMQREYAQFGRLRVAGFAGLASRQTASDDDISEEVLRAEWRVPGAECLVPSAGCWVPCWKAQDVGGGIAVPVSGVERPQARVADQRDADDSARTNWCDVRQPAGQPGRCRATPILIDNEHTQPVWVTRRHGRDDQDR
jgi:hypothetical protein